MPPHTPRRKRWAQAEAVPRGIVRSVLVSGIAGWIMLMAVVLAAPSLAEAAGQGEGAFLWILGTTLPDSVSLMLVVGIAVAQYLCGLATVTSTSRMAFAFAGWWSAVLQNGAMGLPQATDPSGGDLGGGRCVGAVHGLHAGLCDDHGRLHNLSVHFLRAADRTRSVCHRPIVDSRGAVEPGKMVSTARGAECAWLPRSDRHRHAAAE